jgi:hypothetical protein
MSRITKTRLAEGIFLLRFETQYELAATFLRVQEHYESSRFSGRLFSLEQFMDWYASAFGKFTYFEDWTGFNVPSTALEPFYAGRFDPLLQKETRLLRLFERERRPYYVIGVTSDCSRRDLTHEIAHALYFTDPEYRKDVQAAMKGCDVSVLASRLRAMGYNRRVIRDEVHAYLATGRSNLRRSTRSLRALGQDLRKILKRYSAPLLDAAAGGPVSRRSARRRGKTR